MHSLCERVEQLSDELGKLVREISQAQAASEDEAKVTQLRHVNRAISSLESAGAPVPEELRQLRIRLTTELNGPDSLSAAAERLREGLAQALNSLGSSKRARRHTTARNGPVGVPVKVEEKDLPPLGSRLISMSIGGESMPVTYWKDVLVNTGNWMIKNGHELPADGVVGRSARVLSDDPGQFRIPKQLANGRYIETNRSVPDLVRCAYRLLASAGLGKDTLKVEYEYPQ